MREKIGIYLLPSFSYGLEAFQIIIKFIVALKKHIFIVKKNKKKLYIYVCSS